MLNTTRNANLALTLPSVREKTAIVDLASRGISAETGLQPVENLPKRVHSDAFGSIELSDA